MFGIDSSHWQVCLHMPNIPNISKNLFVISCLERCYGLSKVGQWMWSVIGIPPCLRGSVDYLGMVFPSLGRSLPVLFACETWSAWWKSEAGHNVGSVWAFHCLAAALTSLPHTSCSYFGLAGHRAAELRARDMAAFQRGCARGRQGGRVSSMGPLEGFSCSPSLIQAARLSFYDLLCLSCVSFLVLATLSLASGWVWPLLAASGFVENWGLTSLFNSKHRKHRTYNITTKYSTVKLNNKKKN